MELSTGRSISTGAVPVHRPAHAEIDQIRLQRVPGDQDHLHQRDGRSVRGGRRQRPGRCPRHGPRQPHRRKFLHAGPGFGGSCFPKDTVALIRTGEEHGAPLRIVETVASVNDRRKRTMAAQDRQCLRRLGRATGRSPYSASPSSRRPTICARRRRCPSSPGCATSAPTSAPSTRKAWTQRQAAPPRRRLRRRPL